MTYPPASPRSRLLACLWCVAVALLPAVSAFALTVPERLLQPNGQLDSKQVEAYLTDSYHACLKQLPANKQEPLRVAQRAWIVFTDQTEAAARQAGVQESELLTNSLLECVNRGTQFQRFIRPPAADAAALQTALEEAERDLTSAYQACLARLAQSDKTALVKAERAWVDYKEKNQKAGAALVPGYGGDFATLLVVRTRAEELRRLYEGGATTPSPTAALPTRRPAGPVVGIPVDDQPAPSRRPTARGELMHLGDSEVWNLSSERLFQIVGNSQYDLYSQAGAFSQLEQKPPRPEAEYYLAQCYLTGKTGEGGPLYARNQQGFPANRPAAYKLAIPLLERAVERGHVPSMLYLGNLLAEGKYVEQDLNQAAAYWTKAAAKRDEAAVRKLQAWYFKAPATDDNQAIRSEALKVLADNGVEAAKEQLAAAQARAAQVQAERIQAARRAQAEQAQAQLAQRRPEPMESAPATEREPNEAQSSAQRSTSTPSKAAAANQSESGGGTLIVILVVVVGLCIRFPKVAGGILGGLLAAGAAHAAAEQVKEKTRRGISDVSVSGSWIVVYDDSGREINRTSSSGKQLLGSGSDFFVVQNGSWFVTYNEQCREINRMSASGKVFKGAGGHTFTTQESSWIVTYNQNCKEQGRRSGR